jgi:dihydroxy-acid dehydratase
VNMPQRSGPPRRSSAWWGPKDREGFLHRSWMHIEGVTDEVFDGRPVIGIANSWSELTPCNSHLRRVAEAVKRGVWQAGGFPLEFNTMSLGETIMRPTTMLFRNLMSIEVEETIRANPLDGVVLLSGCDKTTPAMLMGAASVDLPAIMVTGGPMLNGKYRGRDVGSGTAIWQFSEEVRAGTMTNEQFMAAEACVARSNGHCMTMGTASTMACMAEALGMQLPGSAAIPAADSRRYATAQRAGQRIVAMVHEDLRPSRILTRHAFENAIRVNAAIGGSTNAVVHLLAIAGRVGTELDLDDFDELARPVPTLVNLMPSGQHLMEDFYYAGGLPALMRELTDLLHTEQVTVTGRSVGTNIEDAECFNADVIRPLNDPVQPRGTGTAILHGNICPRGAVIKQSAASPHLLRHRGQALVFDTIEEYRRAADDPDMAVTEDNVLVVRNAGPRGYPGFPEVGNLPIPVGLLSRGVTDMVRISDARMSGTSYGAVVLHVTPESAVGGPLALLRTGDWIELDVPSRTLNVDLPARELEARRASWEPPPLTGSGYARLYAEHVLQADEGADFDFLVGCRGSAVGRESH